MAHPGGRPTVGTDDNVKRAEKYVAEIEESGAFPTIEQLAYKLGISRSSLYERKEFSDILERMMQIQGHHLITGGLNGTHNSTIAKMLLASKHGYVEKTAQDLTTNGKDLAPALVKFIDKDDA